MAKKQEIMNLKQFLKLITILAMILATIGIFVNSVKYNYISKTYPSMFEMVNFNNYFSFGHLLCTILIIFGLALSIFSLYFDDNKVMPLILFVISIVACVLVFCSASMGAAKINPSRFSLYVGSILAGVSLIISTITCGINSFRMWILKKNN